MFKVANQAHFSPASAALAQQRLGHVGVCA